MRDTLARLYYDTGLAGTAHSIDPVLAVTTPDHVLYGADFGDLARISKSATCTSKHFAAILA